MISNSIIIPIPFPGEEKHTQTFLIYPAELRFSSLAVDSGGEIVAASAKGQGGR